MILCLTGTPIDVTIYDIKRISINPEYSQPVIVNAIVAYRGNLMFSKTKVNIN
jgi:hypothetical protein